jgi:HlyD family secretion protein
LDVKREGVAKQKMIRRIVWGVLGLAAVSGISIGLARLKPAAPEVESATVWTDAVKRGPMLRQVRGLGTLVAEETIVIPTQTDGRVAQRFLLPGATVRPDSIIVSLTNPELDQQALDALYQVKMAEARLDDLKVKLQTDTLNQKAEFARMEKESMQAKLRYDRDEKLFKEGLLVDLTYRISKSDSEQSASRLEIEKERMGMRQASVDAQLALQRTEIDKLRAMADLKKSQVEALKVRAGVDGVLQEVPAEPGQRLPAGAVIAKVAQPKRLKAQLKVPETQAKDVTIGQVVEVDTRNGIIPGRVWRIDPAAREGTVTVDVKLEGELPPGARPDLSVDGTIEVERLVDVIYVGRPASGQPDSQMTLFRLDAGTKEATRVRVEFGKASVNTIEVKQGLQPGDKVILSDTSDWDSYDRIRLK